MVNTKLKSYLQHNPYNPHSLGARTLDSLDFYRYILSYIYTPSVFCYDKHKKNFDIQFSMKRHETV